MSDGAAMTWGQRLYEHKHPKSVRLYTTRAPWGLAVDVPCERVDWQFLTAACQATWERQAIGHHIFSAEEQAQQWKEARDGTQT